MKTGKKRDQLLLDLRDSIRNGTLRSGERLAPVRELAESYKVTTSKAQRVVQRLAKEGLVVCRRGDGSYVAEDVVAQLSPGAIPSGQARPTVGIVLSPFSFSEFVQPQIGDASGGAEFVRGAEEILGSGSGSYHLIPPTESDLKRVLAEQNMKTVMLMHCTRDAAAIEELLRFRRSGGQVIIIEDVPIHTDWALNIRADTTVGIRRAVEHLLQLGHRRIALLSWGSKSNGELAWIDRRREAYEAAVAGAGQKPMVVEVGEARIQNRSKLDLKKHLSRLFGKSRKTTAVVCVNDALAESVLAYAAKSGIRVPEELSVTGIDDAPGAIQFGLTTVKRHFRELGRMASNHALQVSAGTPASVGEIAIEPQLVVRRSTGPAPKQ